jgi:CMP-N,N'-diacetyllegionaminic acid synthase
VTVLAVVPARGGSKGLPRKNVLTLGGLPLVAHALALARLCPQIDRTVVSTEDDEIADVARAYGGEVVDRPAELAGDEVAMLPVLRHALDAVGGDVETLVLLDPTSPLRLPEDVAAVVDVLRARPGLDGVVTASEPHFNVVWQSVVEEDGLMRHLVAEGSAFVRRQDAPRVLYVNGGVYAWRVAFLRREHGHWFHGRTALHETPQVRGLSIDTAEDLAVAEALVAGGVVRLPWLDAQA